MSRSHSFVGLKDEAFDFLEENCIKDKISEEICPHCGKIIRETFNKKMERIELCETFYEEFYLKRFFLKDGNYVDEIIQDEPWSSGPITFLCLKDKNEKKLFEWSDEEINKYL